MADINWFWLSTRDQAANNWILYDAGPPLELRPRYHRFCCPSCGKVDEDAALQSGFDEDVRLRSRCDIFRSSDGILCFSDRTRDIWHDHGIQGIKFLPLPRQNNRKHEVALPNLISHVDRGKAGFQYNRFSGQPELDNEEVFCSLCHRPKEGAYVGPFLDSMTLPHDPLSVITPSISPENLRGKIYWVLVSHIVKDILVKSRTIGVQFTKPF
jgi:hypothetical protein